RLWRGDRNREDGASRIDRDRQRRRRRPGRNAARGRAVRHNARRLRTAQQNRPLLHLELRRPRDAAARQRRGPGGPDPALRRRNGLIDWTSPGTLRAQHPRYRRPEMSRLIRMDSSGHTTLAEWTAEDPAAVEAALAAFRAELEQGSIAMVSRGAGHAEHVRELPLDEQLVIMRRPIAGG